MNYQYVNHHPRRVQPLDTVGSVLHAVSAARGCSWEAAYTALIKASGALGLMPQNKKSIRKMLEDLGFYLQAPAFAHRSINAVISECNEIFHDGEAVIVNASSSTVYGCYLPLVPVESADTVHYVMQYPEDLTDRTASEVWIAWKDGQDHSIMPRRKITRKAAPEKANPENEIQPHETLVVFNENPNDNLIGDCAVRAVAAVLEIPWEEAVRRLAQAQDYSATEINSEENIEAMLRKEGFQAFDTVRRNGKMLTGKEFCGHIHDMFQAGTRIFAYIGNDHAAAILVFDDDYKIVDTWDSTNRYITKYWAKYPERPQRHPRRAAQPDQLTELTVGTKLRHKLYGSGVITGVNGTMATVRFPDGTEKTLAADWILANCKPV